MQIGWIMSGTIETTGQTVNCLSKEAKQSEQGVSQ